MAARTRRPRGLSANHVDEQERLQEIMTDKSTLSFVRLLGKENWVKKEERPNCFYCARKFRPFSLKRHCRSCGEIVCSSCYRRRKVRVTTTLEVTTRLCFDCIDKAMLSAAAFIPVLENPPSTEAETSPAQQVDSESEARQGKRLFGDSIKTSSTGTSFCSRFSEFSCIDNWSDSEDDASDVSSCEGGSSQRGSRRTAAAIPASDLIEFLPEQEQLEIYETRRQEILAQFDVLDTDTEQEYEALCELASRVLECSVAAVAFMDRSRQWYKARRGISQAELPREIAFCSQLLQTPLPTIVMDAAKDPRFNQNPLVTGSAKIRFYATTPICDPNTGIVIGSVFVMDPKPKQKLPLRTMEVLAYVSSAAEKLLLGDSHRRSGTMKHKRHSSPSVLLRRDSLAYPEIRAASLQSVPEEIDGADFLIPAPKSNTSSSRSSSIGSQRGSQRGSASASSVQSPPPSQRRYQLLDPNLELSSSARSRAAIQIQPQCSDTTLVASGPKELATVQVTATTQLQSLDTSCIELFHRITSTQQMLVQQHDTLLATLSQHSSRISSIEQTVDRIEGIILASQRTQSSPQLLPPTAEGQSVHM
ncbi:hypothetical protein BBJ28_00011196 [Nothophytophthora sp. Chile5]|nr:hypothetical protein BBJ28_00011196 [Nothophytophthora sp. Chile5]